MLTSLWQGVRKAVNWYIHIFKGRPWYIKIVSTIASLIVFFILYLLAVDCNFLWLFGKSPSMEMIKNKRPAQASEIYSADGQQIGKFFSENRTPVNYEDVNPVFWEALIDTEDERFYSHHGIDYAAFGAALKDYVMHHDFPDYPYMDFGRSTEGDGSILNEGLVAQKEGFGGRTICYDTYEWDV